MNINNLEENEFNLLIAFFLAQFKKQINFSFTAEKQITFLW